MHDALTDGRGFRLFNVIDDYNREALTVKIDFLLPAQRVIRSLNQLIEYRGKPVQIRRDVLGLGGLTYCTNAFSKHGRTSYYSYCQPQRINPPCRIRDISKHIIPTQ